MASKYQRTQHAGSCVICGVDVTGKRILCGDNDCAKKHHAARQRRYTAENGDHVRSRRRENAKRPEVKARRRAERARMTDEQREWHKEYNRELRRRGGDRAYEEARLERQKAERAAERAKVEYSGAPTKTPSEWKRDLRRRFHEIALTIPKTCPDCGIEFQPLLSIHHHSTQRWCPDCTKLNKSRERDQRRKERWHALVAAVKERDRSCMICGVKLTPAEMADNRLATADHIIPRREGGENTMENLRAAHMVCNSKRQHGPWARLERWKLYGVRAPRLRAIGSTLP